MALPITRSRLNAGMMTETNGFAGWLSQTTPNRLPTMPTSVPVIADVYPLGQSPLISLLPIDQRNTSARIGAPPSHPGQKCSRILQEKTVEAHPPRISQLPT